MHKQIFFLPFFLALLIYLSFDSQINNYVMSILIPKPKYDFIIINAFADGRVVTGRFSKISFENNKFYLDYNTNTRYYLEFNHLRLSYDDPGILYFNHLSGKLKILSLPKRVQQQLANQMRDPTIEFPSNFYDGYESPTKDVRPIRRIDYPLVTPINYKFLTSSVSPDGYKCRPFMPYSTLHQMVTHSKNFLLWISEYFDDPVSAIEKDGFSYVLQYDLENKEHTIINDQICEGESHNGIILWIVPKNYQMQ